MYSRYIPPPRGNPKPPNTDSIASSHPFQPFQPSQIAPKPQPTTYARYVPPPKSSQPASLQASPAQHVRFDEDGEPSQQEPPAKRVKLGREEAATTQPPDGEKAAKSKKKKRKSTRLDGLADGNTVVNGSVVDQVNGQTETEAQSDTPNGLEDTEVQQASDGPLSPARESPLLREKIPSEEATKHKDKKKKKKTKTKDDGESPVLVEEDIPVRHKAILEKKAKSIQRAPEPASEDVIMTDVATKVDDDTSQQKIPEIELHGLEPIPQPKPVELDTSAPSYETLPPWLASPIRVSQDASVPFTDFGPTPDLGITPEIAERLALKGYKQAFAIQTGVIPLLLPNHCKTMQGDILVSAATGSGKTLSYTLPMIRDISQSNRHATRLRALVVVPTRELVKQVQQVCEECAGVFALDGAKRRVRIAMAMGSQSFENEQGSLIERKEVYDPGMYQKKMKRLAHLHRMGHESDSDEDAGYNTEDEERDAIRKREDKLQTLPDHIIAYKSKADILICTPGRLVEHIKFTPGFSLDFVRWLVVDEADKLLGQNFQQWLDVVIPRLRTQDQVGARNHKQSNLSGVRKVILSATMTRDLDQLEGLKLRRPRLIVLEGSKVQDEAGDGINPTEHVLPEFLAEAAIKVSDPNLKPLFLVDLLQSHYILNTASDVGKPALDDDDGDDETSSSGSDSDTDLSSDSDTDHTGTKKPSRPSKSFPQSQGMPTVLIFTKSNETALRLSRLLELLVPRLEPYIGTLTSTMPYATRRDTLRSFNARKTRIIVASDLVARGIDLPSLNHVINYDIPSSIASYVHRVGRTARAGNTGKAWTLFTNPEARWFWNEVASEKVIQRSNVVERVRVTEEKEDAFNSKVAAYEAALEKLGQEAGQARHKS
ncbi:P-loop containing nucleoside triphosphate hydrolase protein [Xylaria cf. heliscus]|nr:P-loop containing nucleoside triphosphate hydrolase protein [Xylaria cf. heliscus]